MADTRKRPRAAVHYRLAVRHGSNEGVGLTENLSDRGAMVSLELDPPPPSGAALQLDLEVPGVGTLRLTGSVRWVSGVLPGIVGVEFDSPIPPELTLHVHALLAEDAVGT
ncbi:MAG: PilZ domain-containing protein [Myxococcales bacterium]|nr:PilZ domain-containing protein [Myxococcales bacterium]